MLSLFFGKALKVISDQILKLLITLRVQPNMLTVMGMVAGVAAGIRLAQGKFISAAIAIALVGFCDLLDGMLARAQNTQTRTGAFLDSVLDRYADISMFIGLIVFFTERGKLSYVIVTSVALLGTVMTSYTRGRAESIIRQCRVGFMERPERIIFLFLGVLFNRVEQTLWVVAVLSNWTAIQRIYHTLKTLRQEQV